MKRLPGMERDHNTLGAALVNSVAALDLMSANPACRSRASNSGAVSRGSLGNLDLDRSRHYLGAQAFASLFRRQSFQVQFNGLADIGKRFFKGRALRLAAVQLWTICVIAVLVLPITTLTFISLILAWSE